jgi:polygalacturonase
MMFLNVSLLFLPISTFGQNSKHTVHVFNVLHFGAVGDGKTLDTAPIQKAIDEAAKISNGAEVLVPAGHQYLVGTLELKSGINFHLEGNAELLVSSNREDYSGDGVITANGANDLTI